MAKKTIKKTEAKADNELSRIVPKLISRGEMRKAAEAVKEAAPSEAQFDALMADHPGLRNVYLSLQS
ncbi:hypothetical protein RJJ65_32105 [Rhizobium hidalgonense]|uniref:Uncharacterized protein n=1 Tax=Rhizobium hidalgonense TaxID=1538159 RepID=A0AAJ2GWF3_9HYPH|nr:hypothetical protein [Rhizobium hidalgonense]MDR9777202.1 hypothetical protein [Rhizobium hidalgonense]